MTDASAMQRILAMRNSLVDLTTRLDDMNRDLVRLSTVDSLTGIACARSNSPSAN